MVEYNSHDATGYLITVLFFQVKDDIEFENLAQRYLKYLLQKECWDDMIVKGLKIDFNFNSVFYLPRFSCRIIISLEFIQKHVTAASILQ